MLVGSVYTSWPQCYTFMGQPGVYDEGKGGLWLLCAGFGLETQRRGDSGEGAALLVRWRAVTYEWLSAMALSGRCERLGAVAVMLIVYGGALPGHSGDCGCITSPTREALLIWAGIGGIEACYECGQQLRERTGKRAAKGVGVGEAGVWIGAQGALDDIA